MNPASNAQRVEPIEEQPEAGSEPLPDQPFVGINWQSVREEYRTGLISNVQLGAKYGISEGAIRKRAKRDQWPKDLAIAVALATKASLARATRLPTDPRLDPSNPAYDPADAARNPLPAQSGEASEAARVRGFPAQDDRSDDEVIVEAAEVGAAVVMSHRRDIREQRQLVSLLLSQLSDVATTRDSIAEVINDNIPSTHYKKREAMQKACALPQHAAIMRDLTTAQRHLVVLERQAFNIGQEVHGGSLEDWLDKLEP